VRILHLVTLLSPDGAFGGPARVALNQAAELRRRGHDVQVAAGWRGDRSRPHSLNDVPMHLFPTIQLIPSLGFSGMVSPKLSWWLLKNVAKYDVLHIHAGRDLISMASLAVAWCKRRPYVIQSHGMIQPDPRFIARLLDLLATRRFIKAAKKRFVLTQREQDGLAKVLDFPVEFERLPNGVPDPPTTGMAVRNNEVLFCARLQRRKRPVAFVEMAGEVLRRGIEASFALVGPDDGELNNVLWTIQNLGLTSVVRYEGALNYEAVLNRMNQSGVFVLPSVDEPFPMSLLEALSLGIPSVCTDTCDIAPVLRRTRSAIVTSGSVEALACAVIEIFNHDNLRQTLATNARQLVSEHFSINAVGGRLEQSYAEVL
jgi:glycosyltransferase involved in cell wall biosynthesis